MDERKRLIYIASFINFSYGMEWMVENIDKSKYEVEFIFLNQHVPDIFYRLQEKGIVVRFIKYSGKKDLIRVIGELFVYFLRHKPHIVHAHLFDACMAAMPAAMMAGVKRRIHTRHHASIHHDSHPHAVKYDRFINYCSTMIIAVSENVKNILINNDKADFSKVIVVHHGFDFSITKVNEETIASMRKKYNLEEAYPVIGVISRFVDWKGVQYIIPAFKKLLFDFPKAKLVLANANGEYRNVIMELLSELPSQNYITIGFEQQIYPLINCFDYFVHVPVNKEAEAFGQIYVEVMSCRIPVVCTLSGIASSYVTDHKNAIVVPFSDSNSIYFSLKELIDNKALSSAIVEKAYKDVVTNFSIGRMTDQLERIYA